MVCCFFGHSDTPQHISPQIGSAVEKLIQSGMANEFLVGNQGQFDRMSLAILRGMKERYPQITYNVVLPYMPKGRDTDSCYADGETMLPEGIECVHPRYAISWRNRWMVDQSDLVICYVARSWGGAVQFVKLAERKGKVIINFANEAQK